MKKLFTILTMLVTSISFGQKLYGTTNNEIYYIENCQKNTVLIPSEMYVNDFDVLDNENLLLVLSSGQNFWIRIYNNSAETYSTIEVLPHSETGHFVRMNRVSDNCFVIRFYNQSFLFNSIDNSVQLLSSSDSLYYISRVANLQKFGSRYGMLLNYDSYGFSAFQIFNSVTNQIVPITIINGSFGYMGHTSDAINYAKLDENTALVIYKKTNVVPNHVLYFAKVNTQNFTMDIYDSIIQPSVAFTDFANVTGMTSLEPNKVLVSTRTGGGEGVGGILEYDVNTRNYIFKHNFTNLNQTIEEYDLKALPFQNKLFNAKISYTLDPANYSVNICEIPSELSNYYYYATKCPECISNSIGGSVGLSKDLDLSTISISPNPTSAFITIANLPAQSNITVIDYTGRVVVERASNNTSEELDLSICKPGMYIVQIASHDKMMQEKVIVK